MSYEAILVAKDSFEDAVRKFQSKGGKGLNITLPFKEQAWQLVNERSARAERAGAVNTIVIRDNGSLYGDNTDGVGLVRDIIQNHKINIINKSLLVLGAGGAVKGVLEPLLLEKPSWVVVANRTHTKALQLVKDFDGLGNIRGYGFDELAGNQFDFIINGTSASIHGEVPAIPNDCLNPNGLCYDMMYSNEPTAFVKWGQAHNAGKSVDGLGMLVEQAAESFFLWRGIRPDTARTAIQIRA